MSKFLQISFLLLTLSTTLLPNLGLSEEKVFDVNKILILKINSSINPATLNYIKTGFKSAKKENFNLIIIKLNTPGGLVSTTKNILTTFGESHIPVIVWVTPEGASATSAGAIIGSGAHLLFMAEGTNIGAATPINVNKDILETDQKAKAINDLKALVQSLSESRGRNELLFGKMIQDASSYKSKEALKKNLINGIANNLPDLLKKINHQTFKLNGTPVIINLSNSPKIVPYTMDLGQKLLDIFANPSMAYILFIIGAALIYFELQAPGGFIAGALGAICLLFAGIGFQLLPLNFGALGLIILSFILFILEVFITSFGLLSILGLGALITGSLFLFRTDDTYMAISISVIISVISSLSVFLLFISSILIKSIKKNKNALNNFNTLEGKDGVITNILPSSNDIFHFQIKIKGEIWKAISKTSMEIGDRCIVEKQKKETMTLYIKSN